MTEMFLTISRIKIYNYDPLCRETSRFVNFRGKLFSRGLDVVFPRVDKSGCFPTQRAVIVSLYFCQCFIGYLPYGGKLGCSTGNNRVVSRQRNFLTMFYRLSPLWGNIGLFGGEQYTIMAPGRGEALGGNNPSGVDNFGYSPIQKAVTVLLYQTNS